MPQVNSIDDIGIKNRLRQERDNPLCAEALQLIKALENALEGQQRVTADALKKLRQQQSEIQSLQETIKKLEGSQLQ